MSRSPKEWAEITIRDIERRKTSRRKGQADADNYIFDMQLKSFKKKSKIRCKTYRGK